MKKNKTLKPVASAELLQERIKRNYEDFKESMLELDSETLFELAPKIAAVKDVYTLLQTNTNEYICEDDAEYLLRYENPLKILADVVDNYGECKDEDIEDMISDFKDMVSDFIENDDGEEYMSVALADELRDKYGDDMPIDSAVVCEIIELGRKLMKC